MTTGSLVNSTFRLTSTNRFGRNSKYQRNRRSFDVADTTGPLTEISNKNVLVLVDVENLSHSATDLGYSLCYRTLGCLIRARSMTADLRAFFSRNKGDDTMTGRFINDGWHPHPRDIQTATTVRGTERFANSDHNIAFGAGLLATQHRYDAIIIGTGDGALGCDLATAIRQHRGEAVLNLTLSLVGSTSWRLNAETNDHLDGNIEVGQDCLFRSVPRRTQFPQTFFEL